MNSIKAFLICVFNKSYAWFYLAIALVVLGECYRLLNIYLSEKFLECLRHKICACICSNFLESNIQQTLVLPFVSEICGETAYLLHNWKLAVIIYNAQKHSVINHEYLSTDHFHGLLALSCSCVCVDVLSTWHIVSLYVLCQHSYWSNRLSLSLGVVPFPCPCDCSVTTLKSPSAK